MTSRRFLALCCALSVGCGGTEPPIPTKLGVQQQPVAATAGVAFSPQLVIAIQDDAGNTISGSTASVTIAIGNNPGGGTLGGITTVAAVNGIATFPGLSIDKSGTGYTLVASSSGLTSATSTEFTVAAGAAQQLAITTQPTSTTAGAAIAPAVTVAIRDAYGNTTTSTAAVTVAIANNAGSGTLSGTATVTAVNGVATFSNLSIDKSGTGYTLGASSTGLTAATSSAFNISAAAASVLVFTTQPTSATAGETIAAPAITVAIRDVLGNSTTSTATVALAIGTNPNGGTLGGNTLAAAVNGVATFSNLSINKAGNGYTLIATATNLTTGTSSAFNVSPAAATHLVFDTQPTNVTVTEPIAPNIVVSLRDAFENVVTSDTRAITVWLTTNADSSMVYGNPTLNAVAGIATFSNLRVWRPGTFTLAAGAASLLGANSNSFTASITFDRVAADTVKTCAISSPRGIAYCWGKARIYTGHEVATLVPTPVAGDGTTRASHSSVEFANAIASGSGHTCALTPAGVAYCWGGASLGALGNGTFTGSTGVPVPVSGGLTFNSGALASGWYHNCGVTTSRAMYCWGYNQDSQLGDGTTTDRNAPVQVGAGTEWLMATGGRYHSCAITFSGPVQCWGNNNHGQLGDGTTTPRTTPTPLSTTLPFTRIGAGGTANVSHTCGIVTGGDAYCWGNNTFGQVGDGTTTSPRLDPTAVTGGLKFTRIAVGSRHACALTSAGAAYCWGANTNGQLGDGTTTQRSEPTLVSGSHTFFAIAAGDIHTCGVTMSATILCWGFNGDGQLGDGTTIQRLVPTPVKQ